MPSPLHSPEESDDLDDVTRGTAAAAAGDVAHGTLESLMRLWTRWKQFWCAVLDGHIFECRHVWHNGDELVVCVLCKFSFLHKVGIDE